MTEEKWRDFSGTRVHQGEKLSAALDVPEDYLATVATRNESNMIKSVVGNKQGLLRNEREACEGIGQGEVVEGKKRSPRTSDHRLSPTHELYRCGLLRYEGR